MLTCRKFAANIASILLKKSQFASNNRIVFFTGKRSLMTTPVFFQTSNLPELKMGIYDSQELCNMIICGKNLDGSRITPFVLSKALEYTRNRANVVSNNLCSPQLVDLLTNFFGKFGADAKAFRVLMESFSHLNKLEERSKGMVYQTVDREKKIQLVNTVLDTASLIQPHDGKTLFDLLVVVRTFLVRNKLEDATAEALKKLNRIVDHFIDKCAERNYTLAAYGLRILSKAYNGHFLPLPENSDRIDQILQIMSNDGSQKLSSDRVDNEQRVYCWLSLLNLLLDSVFGAKVPGAQLDALLALWKWVRPVQTQSLKVVYGSKFMTLCIRLARPDLLEQERIFLLDVCRQMQAQEVKAKNLHLLQESDLKFRDQSLKDEFVKVLSLPIKRST